MAWLRAHSRYALAAIACLVVVLALVIAQFVPSTQYRIISVAHDCGVPNEAGSFDPWQQSCLAAPHATSVPACVAGQMPDPSDGARCTSIAGGTSQP